MPEVWSEPLQKNKHGREESWGHGRQARGYGSTGAEVGARTLSDDLIKAQQRMVGKMDIDPTGKRLDSTFAGFVTHTLVGNLLEHLTLTAEDGEQVRDDRKASVLQNITSAVADRYWRRCEELDLAPPVNSTGLPDRTEMSDVPHFDAYVYAAFQVARGVLAGPELQTRMALFMKRMGVRLYDAMCSIMAKSPSSNNTSLKELRSRLKLLLDKMKEIRLIRSYNVVWTPNAGKLWDQGQPVGFVLELQEPAYQLGAKQLVQQHALDPAIVQHILLSHFTAYQVDAERRVLQVGRPGEPDVKEAWLLMPW